MPGRDLVAIPADIGLDYQDVKFVSEDHSRLHGWLIPNQKADAAALIIALGLLPDHQKESKKHIKYSL